MELDPEHRPPGDGGDEPIAVLGVREHDGSVGRRRCAGLRVDEVEVRPILDPGEEVVLPRPLHLVPADVRQRGCLGQPDRVATQDAQGVGAVLVAAFEEELQPEADTEERAIADTNRAP